MKRKHWWWGLAVLPVVCVPLVAQESKPQAPAEPQPTPAAAATAPAAAKPAADKPEPAAQQPAEPPDERLSADNTLSFPVDI
jgi:hypothetical protein